jgi:hypothetical protein
LRDQESLRSSQTRLEILSNETREKFRTLLLKSKNPQKSLENLRTKIQSFIAKSTPVSFDQPALVPSHQIATPNQRSIKEEVPQDPQLTRSDGGPATDFEEEINCIQKEIGRDADHAYIMLPNGKSVTDFKSKDDFPVFSQNSCARIDDQLLWGEIWEEKENLRDADYAYLTQPNGKIFPEFKCVEKFSVISQSASGLIEDPLIRGEIWEKPFVAVPWDHARRIQDPGGQAIYLDLLSALQPQNLPPTLPVTRKQLSMSKTMNPREKAQASADAAGEKKKVSTEMVLLAGDGSSAIQPTAQAVARSEGGFAAGDVGVEKHRRRSGKEMLQEMGTEQEKKAIVIKLNRARSTAQARLMVVGVFLSMVMITSRQLIDNMKKIWQIRGRINSHQLADRRFVLEFSEEGDYNHVTKGGPWSFKEDAVLIRALEVGEDPEEVTFTTMPIWAQFRDVPFYLLSKELARDLGGRLGELLFIDNDARGDLCDKIMRARVLLPIQEPIQRWIPLVDEIKDDNVVVSVFYERLPSFCLFCGIIGHKKEACNIAAELKIERYSPELGVAPIPKEDTRRWFLPEIPGQDQKKKHQAVPWHFNKKHHVVQAPSIDLHQQAIIAHVANKVGKLSVDDHGPECELKNKAIVDNTASPSSSTSSFHVLLNDKTVPAPTTEKVGAKEPTPKPAAHTDVPQEKGGMEEQKRKNGGDRRMVITGNNLTKIGTWKRVPRKEDKELNTLTTQVLNLRAPRSREMLEEEEEEGLPVAKRTFQVPTLEECLGADNLRRMREEEAAAFIEGICASKVNVTENEKYEGEGSSTGGREEGAANAQMRGKTTNLEATGPGAAGKLSGAVVSAWQET